MEEGGEEREIVEGNNQARQTSLKQHLIQTLEMQFVLTRPFDEIRDIKVGKEVWKLPVRIVNLWYAKDYLKHKHIEMVLMDLNCDRIQMVVPSRYVRSFSSKLVEYQTIILNNFKVKENDLLSRACPNPLKLVWFDGTFISNGSLPPIPEIRFFSKISRKYLEEIGILMIFMEYECITIGTTQQIIVSRDGWTYEGCAWCSKNVFVSEGVLKCGDGHVNSVVTPRYILEIEVIHQEERSVFVFSDSLCAHFFGISAFELKKSLLVEEQCHARFYPLILDDILGLKMVAKVKWSPTFRSCYVHSYSTEQTLVELVESKVFINI
ncbi:replication protein A 70 kDa DNA-binding subunit C [Trifolium repens]|nr:replication protein A 70 kDa DNA-binding subunit C [Trifolium repens]